MGVIPSNPDPSFWAGRRVLVTGHTGFKGSWLVLWLTRMGGAVAGLALDPPTNPSHFEKLQLSELLVADNRGDIRDDRLIRDSLRSFNPEVIFHMAAQPIVSVGYESPAETIDVNLMGTVRLLEEIRTSGFPCVVIVVTSDKCYEAPRDGRELRESDPLGGHDPYSASKAVAEIVSHAYRRSYFTSSAMVPVRLSTVRAGNVIGGGDWARDRLVPDAIRSLSQGEPVPVRNPDYIRPWQHVLEPLCGYLLLAERMLAGHDDHWTSGWNFGPRSADAVPVRQVVEWMINEWGTGSWTDVRQPGAMHETRCLRLSISKVVQELGWQPRWDARQAVERSARWYRQESSIRERNDVRQLSLREIDEYLASPFQPETHHS